VLVVRDADSDKRGEVGQGGITDGVPTLDESSTPRHADISEELPHFLQPPLG